MKAMQNYKKFQSSLKISLNQYQLEDFARSIWEKDQSRKERLKVWCRTTQNKIVNWLIKEDSTNFFRIPKEFDYKLKDAVIWSREIVEWCAKKSLRVHVRSDHDDITAYQFKTLTVKRK